MKENLAELIYEIKKSPNIVEQLRFTYGDVYSSQESTVEIRSVTSKDIEDLSHGDLLNEGEEAIFFPFEYGCIPLRWVVLVDYFNGSNGIMFEDGKGGGSLRIYFTYDYLSQKARELTIFFEQTAKLNKWESAGIGLYITADGMSLIDNNSDVIQIYQRTSPEEEFYVGIDASSRYIYDAREFSRWLVENSLLIWTDSKSSTFEVKGGKTAEEVLSMLNSGTSGITGFLDSGEKRVYINKNFRVEVSTSINLAGSVDLYFSSLTIVEGLNQKDISIPFSLIHSCQLVGEGIYFFLGEEEVKDVLVLRIE